MNRIGNFYLQRGESSKAMEQFSEALRIYKGSDQNVADLEISGFTLYGMSLIHPECAGAA
eukprot:13801900-Ditylum_brightwellii.AAC.1